MNAILRAVLLTTLLLPMVARAGDLKAPRELETSGSAIIRGDETRAVHQAEQDAIRQAIEKVAEDIVGSERLVDNYAAFKESILSKSSRFLKDYRIVDRARSGETMTVKVRSGIYADLLTTELAAIGIQDAVDAGMPTLAVMIEPAKGELGWWHKKGRPGTPDPATDALVAALRTLGFSVVEPSRPDKTGVDPNASATQIKEFLQKLGARAVVRVTMKETAKTVETEGVIYEIARVVFSEIEITSIRTAKTIATLSASGSAGEAASANGRLSAAQVASLKDLALHRATDDAARSIDTAIGKKARRKPLLLVVAGVGAYTELAKLEQVLATEVPAVSEFELSSAEPGEFQYRIWLSDKPNAFAQQLSGKSLGDVVGRVTERSNERVVMHLAKK